MADRPTPGTPLEENPQDAQSSSVGFPADVFPASSAPSPPSQVSFEPSPVLIPEVVFPSGIPAPVSSKKGDKKTFGDPLLEEVLPPSPRTGQHPTSSNNAAETAPHPATSSASPSSSAPESSPPLPDSKTTAVPSHFVAPTEKKEIGLWPDEPMRILERHVDALLLWCARQRATDITLQSDRPVYIEVDGILYPVSRRALDSADMANILSCIYGPDALAKLASGIDLDLSYEVRPERNLRYRFRTNITAILSRGRDSVQITLRSLPNLPPTMLDLGIEPMIIENWAPRQGLVLVTGPTGSGKSTLLAAGCRMLIERAEGCGKLLSYEAPIEYVYDAITGPRSLVSQTEIPRHLPNFAAGVRHALRRKPNIILVGESRDRETMSAAIEAGQTGHLVFSTLHTIGVAATVRRTISVFDPAERTERAFALMETLRMIITQALVPKVGGGRLALREYMVFDENVREMLLDTPVERWTTETQRFLVRYGKTMEQSAGQAFKEGLIDRRTYLLVTRGFSGDAALDEDSVFEEEELGLEN